ncbi:hypothetical protein ACFL6L_03835 [candidate division KSB1 bacterium]
MKNLFWSTIGLIIVLAVLSLALYSGEEEVVTEPLPEDVSAKITELRRMKWRHNIQKCRKSSAYR